MNLLNENISHDDLKKYIKELYNYIAKELNIDVPPRVFLRRDKANADDILGKTGGYDPSAEEIHLYITDRHPKDVLRSFAHELVHHMQRLQGLNDKVNIDLIHKDEAYAQHDDGLREMEREAFEKGNMLFRAWTDGKKMERKNTMNEATKKQKKLVKSLKKSAGETYGAKGKTATSIAHAIKANIEKGKKYQGPGKPMVEESELDELKNKKKADLNKDDKISSYEKKRGEAIEASIEKQAKKQAKDDMAARHGKDKKMDEQEHVESLQENNEQNKHPYPQLLEQKPRLMQDAFNKKEELVYQELIRRFLKK